MPQHLDLQLQSIVSLQAMALNIPKTPGHPNKMPFSGVLTRLNEPSDKPPSGAVGVPVVITTDAAEEAIPSLLGMAVDFTEDFDGHDEKKKIGFIDEAWVDGNELKIKGFFYAKDFPQETARIKAMRSLLGFSWEIADIYTNDVKANPLIITGFTFTGAAVLRKDKAAYHSTSLAASATKGETQMTKEEMEKLLADSMKAMGEAIDAKLKPVVDRIEKVEGASKDLQASAHHVSLVEPHATALEKAASMMEKDGIGGHPVRGHVKACMAMAGHLRAAASRGELASEWPGYEGTHSGTGNMHAAAGMTPEEKKAFDDLTASNKKMADDLAAAATKIADMQAAATKEKGATDDAAKRRTLSPQLTALLAKHGLSTESDKKITVAEIDDMMKKAGLSVGQRLEMKAAADAAGLLAA